MSYFIDKLSSRVYERNCYLIGSAPLASAEFASPNDMICTVNGSSLGVTLDREPDIFFYNGWTSTAESWIATTTCAALKGKNLGTLFLFDVSGKQITAPGIWAFGASMNKSERAAFLSHTMPSIAFGDAGKTVPSTGVVAILALLEAGAARVVVSGVSGSSATGHSYHDKATANHHSDKDDEVLIQLRAHPRVQFTKTNFESL